MVLSSSTWSILGSLFEKLLMLATYIIVSREVAPVEFGYLVLVLLIIELMGYLAGFGVGENIVRKKVLSKQFMSSSFHFVGYVSLILVIVMFVLVTPVSYIASGADLALLVLCMALYPALTTFSGFYIAILQRDMRFKEIAYRTAVISFFSGSVGIVMALSGFGVFSLIAARYVYSIADLIILKYLTGFVVLSTPDRGQLIEIFQFGWKLSASQLLNFSSSRVYEIFVIAFFGPVYLAILDVGRKFLFTLYRISLAPLNGVCLSYLSKAKKPIDSYFTFVTAICLLIVPIVASMGALADQIIFIFFGAEWEASGAVLRVLSVGVIVQPAAWFLSSLAISKGEASVVFIMNIIQTIVLIILGTIAYVASLDFEDVVFCLVTGLFITTFLRIIYLKLKIQFPAGRFILLSCMYGFIYLAFFVVSEAIFCFTLDFISIYLVSSLYAKLFSLMPVGIIFVVYLGGLYFMKRNSLKYIYS
jgi:PST family polysaccharide transporter